jgi:hypothetical protein
MWQPTPHVFTTELGEPCDPRNALRALKTAAKRAGLPSSVGLHTLPAPACNRRRINAATALHSLDLSKPFT